MELETATRYNIHFIVVIINNNGIYSGTEELPDNRNEAGVTFLNP
jgi:thiamine pyrophosphate-dependent acetolactate synthase large subunit-like protein